MKKSGAWYTYEGEQLGQGRENAKTFLTENPEIMVEVSDRIRKQVGGSGQIYLVGATKTPSQSEPGGLASYSVMRSLKRSPT